MDRTEALAYLRKLGYSEGEAEEAISDSEQDGTHAITDPDRLDTPMLMRMPDNTFEVIK